jgi:hypothetical protein
MPLFTLKDHANTLAPFKANETLVVLHNLGTVSFTMGGEGGGGVGAPHKARAPAPRPPPPSN